MINALANKNAQPELVSITGLRPPLFPAGYDWDEQDRVRRAWWAIASEENPELWERLILSASDPRYALTHFHNSENADNDSVGNLCQIGQAKTGRISGATQVPGAPGTGNERPASPRAPTRGAPTDYPCRSDGQSRPRDIGAPLAGARDTHNGVAVQRHSTFARTQRVSGRPQRWSRCEL